MTLKNKLKEFIEKIEDKGSNSLNFIFEKQGLSLNDESFGEKKDFFKRNSFVYELCMYIKGG